MDWFLRYASHLGYRPPFDPLFPASAASSDPVEQVKFVAGLGFEGMADAWARRRPVEEQKRIATALREHNIEMGCIVYTTIDKLRSPMWVQTTREARELIRNELAHAIEVAARMGGKRLALVTGADPQRPLALQQTELIENLKWASDYLSRAGIVLCLESINRKSQPNMLLHHIGDAYRVAKAVDHPAVRIIFDTSHVQAMDGDLLSNLDASWDAIEIVQIADNPGRTEPGYGELNFESIFAALGRLKYGGLVELEHGWKQPGLRSEQGGIARLRELDSAAAAAATTSPH